MTNLIHSSFLWSLLLAIGIIYFGNNVIKKYSILFYGIAILLGIFPYFYLYTSFGSIVPNFVHVWIAPMLYNGALATAIFTLVMMVGALSGKWNLCKKIRIIRGELSIFACILILGHNFTMRIPYVQQLSQNKATMESSYLIAGMLSMVLMLLMLPLMITSFPRIRKKMAAKRWKQIQRLAYVFYGLSYVHVFLIYLPNMEKKLVDFFLYTVVFGSYLVLRLYKYWGTKRETLVYEKRKWICSGITAIVVVFFTSIAVMASHQSEATFVPPTTDLELEATSSPTPSEEPLETIAPEETMAPVETMMPVETMLPVETTTPEASTSTPSTSPSATTTVSPKPTQTPTTGTATATPTTAPTVKPTKTPGTTSTTATPTKAPTTGTTTTTPAVTPITKPTQTPVAATATPTVKPTATPTAKPTAVPTPTPKPKKYKDGTYTGYGSGYGGTTIVHVTVKDDVITNIEVEDHEDTPAFFQLAKAVIQKILNAQSTSVDGVSGATLSSNGIKSAVSHALSQAKN